MGNSSSKSTGNIGETSNSMVDELDLLRGMQQQILLLQQQQPQMLLQPQQQQQMLLLQQPQPRSTAERQLRACLRLIAGSMNNLTENVQNLPLFAILVCTVQRGIANDGRFILFIEINGNNYYLWRGNNNPMGYKGQLSRGKVRILKMLGSELKKVISENEQITVIHDGMGNIQIRDSDTERQEYLQELINHS